jgi:peptidoglycan/LPS O-acetylase OafA/YrhL
MDTPLTVADAAFVAFGLAMQALLLGFFAARRWLPERSGAIGRIVYGAGLLGAPLGVFLIFDGQSWSLYDGPLLTAAWAAFGAWVDLVQPRRWRRPPDWNVAVPYVGLYLASQLFMWWPMWAISRAAWLVFLVLFVPSTLLNIGGHVSEDGGD